MKNPFEEEYEETRKHIRVMEVALTLACEKLSEFTPQGELSDFGYWYSLAEKSVKRNG